MPEPTTADSIDTLRGKVERSHRRVSDVMCSLADLADLLTAHDQMVEMVTGLSLDVSNQSKRARDAEARAAAAEARALAAQRESATHKQAAVNLAHRAATAEAAVQRVRELADNLALAGPGTESAVACRWIRHALNGPDSGSAGQPAGLAGEAGDDAAPLSLPADPAPTSVSGIVNAAPDDQPVTVAGWIHHVEPRDNHAGAPFVELVLVDRDAEIEDVDPDTVKVVVPAPVYARMDVALMPREGTLVEVTGRAVREVVVIASGVREVEVDQS